jgi:quercetin dioxygenase-like cupin family protein
MNTRTDEFSANFVGRDTGSLSVDKEKVKWQRKEWDIKPGYNEWPVSNYIHPPSSFYQPGTNGIYPENMTSFYVAPGEFGYFLDGKDFGFEALSFVLTNTQPGGGPPLHRHETEEAHIVTDGEVMYYLDGEKFKLKGPFVIRIPPGKPHTFLNIGNKPFHLIAAFPAEKLDITELGPNPLVNY